MHCIEVAHIASYLWMAEHKESPDRFPLPKQEGGSFHNSQYAILIRSALLHDFYYRAEGPDEERVENTLSAIPRASLCPAMENVIRETAYPYKYAPSSSMSAVLRDADCLYTISGTREECASRLRCLQQEMGKADEEFLYAQEQFWRTLTPYTKAGRDLLDVLRPSVPVRLLDVAFGKDV